MTPDTVTLDTPPQAQRIRLGTIASWFITVLAALVIIGEFIVIANHNSAFWLGQTQGVYWLSSNSFGLSMPIMFAVFPASVWLVGGGVWHFAGTRKLLAPLLIGLPAGAAIFVVLATLHGPDIGQRGHVGSVRVGERVFHLADRTVPVGPPDECDPPIPIRDPRCGRYSYWHAGYLFECDTLGIVCRLIYFSDFSELIEEEYGAVAYDPSADVIQMINVDGEVVRQYSPP